MRRLRPVSAAALALLAGVAVPAIAADSNAVILGTWATQKNHGKVVIEACGGAVCGRVIDGRQLRENPNQTDVNNPDESLRSRRIMGLRILDSYTGGPSEWKGGTIYDPQTGDSTDDTTLTLTAPGTLIVKGCRFFFCRSETWTKLSTTANSGG